MEQRQLIDLLNDMSLEEKAGQLFQVTGDWFDGMEAGSSAIIRIIHPSHTLVLLLKVLCCISHT